MSLLSNKSLHLHVGVASVRGTLRARWVPRKALASSSQEFDRLMPGQSGALLDATIGKPCSMAIDAVLSELKANVSSSKPRLYVILADSCVHFDVVQGDYGAASDRHLQSIATACIGEVLGDGAASQVIRWQLQPDSRHLLISCIDQRDVSLVKQAASTQGLQVHSLQPDFCVQWNQFARTLPPSRCVFATVNEGYAIVAYAQNGTIMALSCGPSFSGHGAPDEEKHTGHAVDERTDRLLASLGQEASDISTFVLVTSTPEGVPNVSRWTVFNSSKEQA